MNKLSFRARALDASKPMPIYMAEELPDLPDYSAINRAVPQMPSGMQKEEECEHHLQRAICTGLIIPTPEVTSLTDVETYDKIYPADYKLPRQLIHMQPFAMEQDIPDYDMDSEDEKWVGTQNCKMDLTPLQFEEMMDRLEKSSGQTVVTLNEAKALLKEDDDLIIAVFDYWLNKRLKTQHPLLLTVKTEHRLGSAANNPYLAFRRRTERMQTRKNRKNDETSYEKMLKLRRDLSRAVTLLEMVKRREKTKREHLHLTIEVYEKRYQAQDFSGQILAEVSALKTSRPAFAPLFTNQFGIHQNWTNKMCGKDDVVPRKEKRQYKRRKHKVDVRSGVLEDCGRGGNGNRGNHVAIGSGLDPLVSSDDDSPLLSNLQPSLIVERDDEDVTDEGQFAFRRNRNNNYLPPVSGGFGNWPWCDRQEGGLADKKYRFALTSINKPTSRCIGLARRRIGRGGRVILDRYSGNIDNIWSTLDFTIHKPTHEAVNRPSSMTTVSTTTVVKKDWLHFRPKTPPPSEHSPSEESSDDDSEAELVSTKAKPVPFPFPTEATSICVDIEQDHLDDEPPFTSEFNISDYFSVESLSDFDLALSASNCNSRPLGDNDWQTDDFGCSRFLVLPEVGSLFTPQIRLCSGSANSVNTSNCSAALSTLYASNQITTSNTSVSTQCTSVSIETQSNPHNKYPRQLPNNSNVASILSKSLITSTTSRGSSQGSVKVFGTPGIVSGSSGTLTNFGNGHQNGPVTYIHNSRNLSNSTHLVNNQSMILLPQKHPSTNLLPDLNKYASYTRQQQQTQSQTQQIPTTGEIALNSNR